MAKVFIKGNREPFDIPFEVAKEVERDWANDSLTRSKKVKFPGFAGTLGDIKSFDFRSEAKPSFANKNKQLELTPEQIIQRNELVRKTRIELEERGVVEKKS